MMSGCLADGTSRSRTAGQLNFMPSAKVSVKQPFFMYAIIDTIIFDLCLCMCMYHVYDPFQIRGQSDLTYVLDSAFSSIHHVSWRERHEAELSKGYLCRCLDMVLRVRIFGRTSYSVCRTRCAYRSVRRPTFSRRRRHRAVL